jgi:hypothetical protein
MSAERSQTSNDVGVVLFGLVDIEQVKALRPTVSPGAARLLDIIDEYPAACRWSWHDFVPRHIWPDEPYAHEAIEIALIVGRQWLAQLAEIAA